MRSRFIGCAGWLKNSCIDYPGTVATVLFFSGCNLRCPYCHNPAIVNGERDISGRSDEIWRFLEARRGRIEGVVISGGEPTCHATLERTIHDIQHLGYGIKLDTNGLLPEMIRRFSPDYLALDIKTDPDRYGELLNAPFADAEQRLAQSCALVREMGEKAEVRITVAPGFINRATVRRLADFLRGVNAIFLQPVRTSTALLDPSFARRIPPSRDEIREYRHILAAAARICRIRGESDIRLDEE